MEKSCHAFLLIFIYSSSINCYFYLLILNKKNYKVKFILRIWYHGWRHSWKEEFVLLRNLYRAPLWHSLISPKSEYPTGCTAFQEAYTFKHILTIYYDLALIYQQKDPYKEIKVETRPPPSLLERAWSISQVIPRNYRSSSITGE